MTSFSQFALDDTIQQAIKQLGYDKATPVQAESIPVTLQGHDVLASAQTGTGKTAAFSLPLIHQLLNTPDKVALILTPTRELATQVHGAVQSMSRNTQLKSCLIVGGKPMFQQIKQLKKQPRIIIGTPGRVLDLLQQKALKLNTLAHLVLDEMDRMLDMGFSIQIDAILEYAPSERQTLMFSATLPKTVMKLVKKYLHDYKTITVGPSNRPIDAIKTSCIPVQQDKKNNHLVEILTTRSESTIVFVRTKHQTERIAKLLEKKGLKTGAFQGDLSQRKRERVLKQFRDQKINILVATDIAARGIDINHVGLVINLDLPRDPEDYIHRIGRTGRAGAKGEAISFVAPQEKKLWHAIEVLLGLREDKPHSRTQKKGKPNHRKPGFKTKFQGKHSKTNGKQKEGERRSSEYRRKKPGTATRSKGEHPKADFSDKPSSAKRKTSDTKKTKSEHSQRKPKHPKADFTGKPASARRKTSDAQKRNKPQGKGHAGKSNTPRHKGNTKRSTSA